MKTILFVCTDLVLVDQQSNNTSLINLLEDVTAPGFPLVLPRLSVIWLTGKEAEDPEKGSATLSYYSNDKKLADFSVAFDFAGKLRHRTVLVIGGFPIQEPGTVKFEIVYKEKVLGTYTIPIALAQQVTAAPIPGAASTPSGGVPV